MSWETIQHLLIIAVGWGLYFYWRKRRGAK